MRDLTEAPVFTALARQTEPSARVNKIPELGVHLLELLYEQAPARIVFIPLGEMGIGLATNPADYPLPDADTFQPGPLPLPSELRALLDFLQLSDRGILIRETSISVAINEVLRRQQVANPRDAVLLPEFCRWIAPPADEQPLWPPNRTALIQSLSALHTASPPRPLPALFGADGKRFLVRCYAQQTDSDVLELDLRQIFSQRIMYTGQEVLLSTLTKLEQALAEYQRDIVLVLVGAEFLLLQPLPFATSVLERLSSFDRPVLTCGPIPENAEISLSRLAPLKVNAWSRNTMAEFVVTQTAGQFAWTDDTLSVFAKIVHSGLEETNENRFSPWRVEAVLHLVQHTVGLSEKELPYAIRPDDLMNVVEVFSPNGVFNETE